MRLGRAAAFTAGAAALIIGGVWMLQDHFIYFPGPDPGAPPHPWEEMEVETADGLVNTTWTRDGDGDTHRPVVIVFPGNAGNREGRLPLGNRLAQSGFPVVLSEYRGYGGNPGRPSEAGLIADGKAIVEATEESGVASSGIVYFGESLGAAVAIAVAVDDPPDALVLGSPFTSLADVGRHHYPFLPVGTLLRDEYPSLERIESGSLAGVPVLVIGGSADGTVPIHQSRMVAEALGADLYEVEGADHNDSTIRSAPAMIEQVASFVEQALDMGMER